MKGQVKLFVSIILIFFFIKDGNAGVTAVFSTKHNLSTTGPGPVMGIRSTRVCVFCHTPHNSTPAAPKWNKMDPGGTYKAIYDFFIRRVKIGQPDSSSKICLACHDGTIAIDSNLKPWEVSRSSSLQIFEFGSGKPGRLTSVRGSSAANALYSASDHPFSFVYDTALSMSDGELRDPSTLLPLDNNSKLQCASCHDPHDSRYGVFLRTSGKQIDDQAEEGPDAMICLICHVKKDFILDSFNWIGSSHQASTVANESYKEDNYLGKSGAVWENACLSCHAIHLKREGRRLLLKGSEGSNGPKKSGVLGSEETCYLCHTSQAESLLNDPDISVKDIKTEFAKQYHMPITNSEQAYSVSEIHDVINADLEETSTDRYSEKSGIPNLAGTKRHVECTDCHNPHRLIKNSRFDGSGIDRQGTHDHIADRNAHTNLASGSLKGGWGVDPVFSFTNWDKWPTGVIYNKKGTPDGTGPVSKEFEICLKCHSSYAYGKTPPVLGKTGGNTLSGTNNVDTYTDQAKEFSPNNAGFHPVIAPTRRTLDARSITATVEFPSSPFLFPWSGPSGTWIGSQTMYCSDCHGKNTTGLGNNAPSPWGPHGSENRFILLGNWDFNTGTNASTDGLAGDLCFKCHDADVYAFGAMKQGMYTGFRNAVGANLHAVHINSPVLDMWETNNAIVGGLDYPITCMTCHGGVMHGIGGGVSGRKGYNLLTAIKAKAAPCTVATDVDFCIDRQESDEKPYRTSRSRLRVEDREGVTSNPVGQSWGTSGNWESTNCASAENGNGILSGCRN